MKRKSQLTYTLAILENYQAIKDSMASTDLSAPKIVYNNLYSMLEESLLLGSTKYGLNYIF